MEVWHDGCIISSCICNDWKLDNRMMKNSTKNPTKTLFATTAGVWVKIVSLPVDVQGARFIRLGIIVGAKIRCIERLPGGTIVIQKHRQQIAIGHTLAKQITVAALGQGE
jgi:Fe2+ transport system protein FeoA